MEKSLKERVLSLVKDGKSYSEIKEKLKCTKSTISYHCKNAGLKNINLLDPPSMEEIKNFQKIYDETNSSDKVALITGWSKPTVLKYIKTTIKEKMTTEEAKKVKVSQTLYYRKKIKIQLVEYKGGKCENCGYNKCLDALDFHHRDPNKKDFGIGGKTKSIDKMKKEADKCVLVCANCHREIHAGLIKI